MNEQLLLNYGNYGNFFFLRKKNHKLHHDLFNIEKQAKFNVDYCSKQIRIQTEILVSYILEKEKLDLEFKREMRNQQRKPVLADMEKFLERKSKLPKGSVNFEKTGGKMDTEKYISYLRMFSNAAVHSELSPRNPVINYNNLITCLRVIQSIYADIYKEEIQPEFYSDFYVNPREHNGFLKLFMEDYMPIEEYFICTASTPKDSERSQCKKEYIAKKLGHNGDVEQHALIRLYETKDVDAEFILRNHDVFIKSKRAQEEPIPKGMTILHILKPSDPKLDQFIAYIYDFNRPFEEISNQSLNKMSIKERLVFLHELSLGLAELHNASTPIYHRNLSYECVYFERGSKRIKPYMVKFDFAKIITNQANFYTVKEQFSKAKQNINELSIEKYLAPELRFNSGLGLDDFEKVDSYSFGILIVDFLLGNLKSKRITEESLESLEELGISDSLINIIEDCLSEVPGNRPNISKVAEVISEELILH